MKISTKGRYALRLLVDLAENQGDGFVSLKDVSERQGLSRKYLEQIVPLLIKADFLKTSRGFQGGYRLEISPADLTVGQVLRVTEGSISPVACLDHSPIVCDRKDYCKTLPLWEELQHLIDGYLDSVTLENILKETVPSSLAKIS